MKKLIAGVAAMLAATLLSGNAFAITGSEAKVLHILGSAVKVHHCRHRHGCYHRACDGCRLYTYTTRYTACGICGGGACWGGCGYYGPQCGCGGCGYYGGGWSPFGWLF